MSEPRRRALLRRASRETKVLVDLDLDPEAPRAEADTGIGFLDHMLASLATHAGFALSIVCRGDLEVDDHHSAEDCALALGEALALALARGRGVRRFASAYAPLDEALARAVVDLSGRPYCRADLGLAGPGGSARLGGLAGENVAHFFWSLAAAARMTVHVDVLAGDNAHHRAEAAFKAVALALGEATRVAGTAGPSGSAGACAGGSTKGSVALEELDEEEWKRAKEDLDGRGR